MHFVKGSVLTRIIALVVLPFLLIACGQSMTTDPTVLKLTPFVASTDLAVGLNRVVFAILDSEGRRLSSPELSVAFDYIGDEGFSPGKSVPAVFRQWPGGNSGVYTTEFVFDRAGDWGIKVSEAGEKGLLRVGNGTFIVNQMSSTPELESKAPLSDNRTLSDVNILASLTTDPYPDKDLYQLTIANAFTNGKPTVFVLATPAFCQVLTCGPQVDVVKELKNTYKDKVNFIHVEIFDNIIEMDGDYSKGHVNSVVEEWGLPSEPWTFVIDTEGLVVAKFEGFTSALELEEALLNVLR